LYTLQPTLNKNFHQFLDQILRTVHKLQDQEIQIQSMAILLTANLGGGNQASLLKFVHLFIAPMVIL
jgi:hypothetical protein